jgi:hypothetical protein
MTGATTAQKRFEQEEQQQQKAGEIALPEVHKQKVCYPSRNARRKYNNKTPYYSNRNVGLFLGQVLLWWQRYTGTSDRTNANRVITTKGSTRAAHSVLLWWQRYTGTSDENKCKSRDHN